MPLNFELCAIVNGPELPIAQFVHSETICVMRSIRTERGEQFGRQLHAFSFQLLECLRHRVAVMKNQQLGDQVVVLDDF